MNIAQRLVAAYQAIAAGMQWVSDKLLWPLVSAAYDKILSILIVLFTLVVVISSLFLFFKARETTVEMSASLTRLVGYSTNSVYPNFDIQGATTLCIPTPMPGEAGLFDTPIRAMETLRAKIAESDRIVAIPANAVAGECGPGFAYGYSISHRSREVEVPTSLVFLETGGSWTLSRPRREQLSLDIGCGFNVDCAPLGKLHLNGLVDRVTQMEIPAPTVPLVERMRIVGRVASEGASDGSRALPFRNAYLEVVGGSSVVSLIDKGKVEFREPPVIGGFWGGNDRRRTILEMELRPGDRVNLVTPGNMHADDRGWPETPVVSAGYVFFAAGVERSEITNFDLRSVASSHGLGVRFGSDTFMGQGNVFVSWLDRARSDPYVLGIATLAGILLALISALANARTIKGD